MVSVLVLALGLTAVASGAPVLTIDAGPSGPTSDPTPEFEFHTEAEATFECSIDQGEADYGDCTGEGSHTSAEPLDDGSYTFRVRATDLEAEPGETVATRDFSVDTVDPTVSISSGPNGPVADDTPTFGFTGEAGATFECYVNEGSASYSPCSSPYTPATLPDGSYIFRVRATDTAGNVSPVDTREFSVDTVAPNTSITSQALGTTDDTSPTFTFNANEGNVTFECRRDSEPFAPCTSPKTYSSLSEGTHEFAVRATDTADPAGNVDATPAIESFTIDTVAPTVSIDSGPNGPVADDTPTFGFTGEAGATFECSVDEGSTSYSPCSNPHTPATLPDGDYIFRVRATDTAGNVSPVDTREFSVDTIAPNTSITSQALGTTDDTSPTFTFNANEDDVTFECRRDNETFAPCSSPKAYSSLTEGPHKFEVQATDAAGNVDLTPEVENFTIDFTNPRLAIISGPEGPTKDSTPSFGFDAEGGTDVECSIDPVAQTAPSFGPCTNDSLYVVNDPLIDGSYTFAVRASDGPNETIETQDFTVDTILPNTSITSGPPSFTNSRSPSFTFSSNETGVISFECHRDGEDFAPCTSPKAYAGLPEGTDHFYVRAIDAAGNVDASVAMSNFTIDTVAPTVSIDFGPTGTTSDNSPLFGFTVTDGSASGCSIDQGSASFGPCSSGTSHGVTQILADGAYTFRVRGSDAAGNSAIATRSFTISTGAKPPQPQPLPPATPSSPRLLSPFPLVRLAGGLTARGVKVNTLTVRAPRGSVVRVRVQPRCAKKARCAVKLGSATVGKKGAVRFKRFERLYRAGTTIEVRVSRTGLIGKYTRFVVRRNKGPKRLDRCLMPGATRASRCPAA